MPRLLVLASGTAEGGGSGFEALVAGARTGLLDADIVAVGSNHAAGGVRRRADRLGIPFVAFPGPWTPERYARIAEDARADFVALSGWLKHVSGLDPARVFNIHPGPLPAFGGPGLYGAHVHRAVLDAFRLGRISHTAVTMHFISDEYDRGAPVFFRFHIRLREDDDAASLAARVGAWEHHWQPRITDLVVRGAIRWDGRDGSSLVLPDGYEVDRYDD